MDGWVDLEDHCFLVSVVRLVTGARLAGSDGWDHGATVSEIGGDRITGTDSDIRRARILSR
jgi:hypothetical protein